MTILFAVRPPGSARSQSVRQTPDGRSDFVRTDGMDKLSRAQLGSQIQGGVIVKEMYEDGKYAELNPGWHEEDAPWKARHIAEIIRSNKLPSSSICEVGCGTGDVLLNLSKSFPESRLSGYEIARHAYERAKTKETTLLKYNFGNILEADVAPFDIVILADVIEHIEDYVSFLKSIKPVGHHKIFHVPLDLSVQSVLRSRPILNLRENVGHIHYFFKDTILATLRDCGHEIVDYRYTASRLELPNQALSSRLMQIPRRLAYAVDPDLAVRILGGYSLLVVTK